MGKVRRIRQKYHLSKVAAAKSEKIKAEENVKPAPDSGFRGILPSENIFAGVDINFDSLTKTLPKDFDARSIASTKSRKELKLEEQYLKKKVKLKLRRERFLQKLDVTRQAVLAAKKHKRKTKKEQAGNDNPLMNRLLSLESSTCNKINQKQRKLARKPKGILKMKRRLKQQTTDSKLMMTILKDKGFQSNPGQTIKDYLKYKLSVER